jgi:hypothetical protein
MISTAGRGRDPRSAPRDGKGMTLTGLRRAAGGMRVRALATAAPQHRGTAKRPWQN